MVCVLVMSMLPMSLSAMDSTFAGSSAWQLAGSKTSYAELKAEAVKDADDGEYFLTMVASEDAAKGQLILTIVNIQGPAVGVPMLGSMAFIVHFDPALLAVPARTELIHAQVPEGMTTNMYSHYRFITGRNIVPAQDGSMTYTGGSNTADNTAGTVHFQANTSEPGSTVHMGFTNTAYNGAGAFNDIARITFDILDFANVAPDTEFKFWIEMWNDEYDNQSLDSGEFAVFSLHADDTSAYVHAFVGDPTAELGSLIDLALDDGVRTGTVPADEPWGQQFVTAAVNATYDAAISAAQAVYTAQKAIFDGGGAVDETALNNAVTTLQAAMDTYKLAIQIGEMLDIVIETSTTSGGLGTNLQITIYNNTEVDSNDDFTLVPPASNPTGALPAARLATFIQGSTLAASSGYLVLTEEIAAGEDLVMSGISLAPNSGDIYIYLLKGEASLTATVGTTSFVPSNLYAMKSVPKA